MAPVYIYQGDSTPTNLNLTTAEPTTASSQNSNAWDMQIRRWSNEVFRKMDKETKKEREKRIAKEKMYASWKTHNQREAEKPKVFQIKQICKPRHQMSHIGGRRR
jgi:hypothetical protein